MLYRVVLIDIVVESRMQLSKNEVKKFAECFGDRKPKEVLEWALHTFYPKIALASSFSAEDVVLIDMIQKINSRVRIFTLDTGRLHQETYDFIDTIRQRYGVKVEVYCPHASSVEKMISKYGVNLFYKSIELRTLCCQTRKIKPLERALHGLDAWVTGLRREQCVTRSDLRKVEFDEAHGGIIKVNPLADWTHDQVWTYIKENKVPYNKLYDMGYASIGCEPCTRPIEPGENPRAGRWWWELGVPKECGIHYRIRRQIVNIDKED